jgi:predicted ABC-type ATPase
MPSLYIIGGANGSGKTTVSMSLLPNFLDCFEYVSSSSPVFVGERITNQQPIIYVNETWNRITEVEND